MTSNSGPWRLGRDPQITPSCGLRRPGAETCRRTVCVCVSVCGVCVCVLSFPVSVSVPLSLCVSVGGGGWARGVGPTDWASKRE